MIPTARAFVDEDHGEQTLEIHRQQGEPEPFLRSRFRLEAPRRARSLRPHRSSLHASARSATRRRESFCVWDLEVFWQERCACVETVLAPCGASPEAYLAATCPAPTRG